MTIEKSQESESLKVETYPNGRHPNSLKNLKPYPKGVSGNEGSGKGYSLTAELKHALKDLKKRKEFINSTIEGAIKREVTPFKEVWDRIEGKVVDRTDHTFDGDGLSELLNKLRGYNPKQIHNGDDEPPKLNEPGQED